MEKQVVSILPEFTPLDALWSGPKPAFPSETSARWFIRQHRKALSEAGALALLRRQILVHPTIFAEVVQREAVDAMRRRDGGAA